MSFKELKTRNAIRATGNLLVEVASIGNPFNQKVMDGAVHSLFMIPQNGPTVLAIHRGIETLRETCPSLLAKAIRRDYRMPSNSAFGRYFEVLAVMITIERELEAGQDKEQVIQRNALILQGIIGQYGNMYLNKPIPEDSVKKKKPGLYGDPRLEMPASIAMCIYECIDLFIEEIEEAKKKETK